MIRGSLNSAGSICWRLIRSTLLAGGAALVALGLGTILLPLLLGLTLLAAARWASGEPTVEFAAS
jgi:hypothetical protein